MVLGRITVKRVAKWSAGRAAVIRAVAPTGTNSSRACVFVYHRTAPVGLVDPSRDDWNVSPATLERQITALARSCEIVPLAGLRARLSEQRTPEKPLVALTFDDGFSNVVRHALPVLRRHGVSATLFPVTAHVGSDEPMGFDRWAVANQARVERDAWRAVTWSELETWVAAGMELGAHSHRHLNGRDCGTDELYAEARRSREALTSRFGSEAGRSYAYPYGSTRLGHVPFAYREAARAAGFEQAVTTDLGLVDAAADPYALPRLEAHPLDSPAVLRAKARGALAPYTILDRLRRADRA